MGYHNKDHNQRRIISTYKPARIYESNLAKAGVAYRIINGKTQTSSVACKLDDIVYALFERTEDNDLIEDIYIRYQIKDDKGLDRIAFSWYDSKILAMIDLLQLKPNTIWEAF